MWSCRRGTRPDGWVGAWRRCSPGRRRGRGGGGGRRVHRRHGRRGGAAGARVEPAPPPGPGVAGKAAACAHGAEVAAAGRWLAFVDADVVLAPGALSRLLAACLAGGAVAASPLARQATGSWWEELLLPDLGLQVSGWTWTPWPTRAARPPSCPGSACSSGGTCTRPWAGSGPWPGRWLRTSPWPGGSRRPATGWRSASPPTWPPFACTGGSATCGRGWPRTWPSCGAPGRGRWPGRRRGRWPGRRPGGLAARPGPAARRVALAGGLLQLTVRAGGVVAGADPRLAVAYRWPTWCCWPSTPTRSGVAAAAPPHLEGPQLP